MLPNGHLLIAGEKQIGVNQNVDVLRFSGQVDPRMIQSGNVVASAQIANVRIEQRGRGAQADAQGMGWLSPLLFERSADLRPRRIGVAAPELRRMQPIDRILRASLLIAAFLASAALWWPAPAQAARIKEVASVQGVRTNQLVGYGLVVGLDGTGDQTTSAHRSRRRACSRCCSRWA